MPCGEWEEWGVGGNENNCGLELARSRINFNRRDPLAGFTTPVFERWNGSGLIFLFFDILRVYYRCILVGMH